MIDRVSIDDNLGGKLPVQDLQSVRTIESLRKTAVALDQIVNRTNAAIHKGHIHDDVRVANAGDLAEARRHAAILRCASDTSTAMADAMQDQLEAFDRPPEPEIVPASKSPKKSA